MENSNQPNDTGYLQNVTDHVHFNPGQTLAPADNCCIQPMKAYISHAFMSVIIAKDTVQNKMVMVMTKHK